MPSPLHIPALYSPHCSGGSQILRRRSSCGAEDPEISSGALRKRVFSALWPNLSIKSNWSWEAGQPLFLILSFKPSSTVEMMSLMPISATSGF